jgi:hypothetical protein
MHFCFHNDFLLLLASLHIHVRRILRICQEIYSKWCQPRVTLSFTTSYDEVSRTFCGWLQKTWLREAGLYPLKRIYSNDLMRVARLFSFTPQSKFGSS